MLCFNGSDYYTDVWVNGTHAMFHAGGFTPFSVEITEFLKAGENVLVVRCFDPLDPAIPRGKQSWTGEPFGCWYAPNTGIWQSVWIDFFGEDCIEDFRLTPRFDDCTVEGEISTLLAKAEGEGTKFSSTGSPSTKGSSSTKGIGRRAGSPPRARRR